MALRLLWLFFVATVCYGCLPERDKEWLLDRAIPRIQTPANQIVYVGTTWVNQHHRQTTLYDRQGRVLETFVFGIVNAKTINRYDGDKKVLTIRYNKSDSSPPGEVSIDTIRRTFDKAGRAMTETTTFTQRHASGQVSTGDTFKRSLRYNAVGDTIITQQTYSDPKFNRYAAQQTNIDRWEHDQRGRATRRYRLYVMEGNSPLDTIYYWSQRFAYDSSGNRVLAWFDMMHLGRFYLPAGPDTIRYEYDSQRRVVRQVHRYTTDRRNKREINPAGLSTFDKKRIVRLKRQFYIGDEYAPNNNRTDIVEHRYEPFNFKRHIPLRIPMDMGY